MHTPGRPLSENAARCRMARELQHCHCGSTPSGARWVSVPQSSRPTLTRSFQVCRPAVLLFSGALLDRAMPPAHSACFNCSRRDT
jgi:hypothetical protein